MKGKAPKGFLSIHTLSNKGLAGVQQDVTALHNHPLYGQVLPDVLCVAHLIVHHSERAHTDTPISSVFSIKMYQES